MAANELAELRAWNEENYPADVERPRTRADCLEGGGNAARPCPFASCTMHLAVYVQGQTVRLNFPDGAEDFPDLPETCALDVAERGGLVLEEVGLLLNVTRERVRQMEAKGLRKLTPHATPHGPDGGTDWRGLPRRFLPVVRPKPVPAAPKVPAVALARRPRGPRDPARVAAAAAARAGRGPLLCIDCGEEFPRRVEGMGRQYVRCEKCREPYMRKR